MTFYYEPRNDYFSFTNIKQILPKSASHSQIQFPSLRTVHGHIIHNGKLVGTILRIAKLQSRASFDLIGILYNVRNFDYPNMY